jgi:hypothetical protein
MLVPMTVRGPGTRSQGCQVHAILCQAKEIPKGPLLPAFDCAGKLRRVDSRSSGCN